MNYLKSLMTIAIASTLLLSNNLYAQWKFPQDELDNITNNAMAQNEKDIFHYQANADQDLLSETILRQQKLIDNIAIPTDFSKSIDTLYIGDTPFDSVYITGDYFYDGTIAVIGEGKLVFEDCTGTITGDILVYGTDAKLWITNSTLSFPQSFWYQRSIIAGYNGVINISGSTLNYNGLPHDLVITQDAVVNQTDITNIGFTTCGLSLNGSINIDNSNQAGEFVMTDNASGLFMNSETVLVWHHIPDGGILDYTFPDGESMTSFGFSNADTGVTNIDYSYTIADCTDVKWGLMPEPGSDITISNSSIRTIGVWFKDIEDFAVSGLVNNSSYTDFNAPMSSHDIHLINTDVQTWSLYFFSGATGVVNSCIVGEIGTMGNSECTAENCLIDGSGGYLFATDTTVATSAFTYLNSNFQASGNALGIMAYGGQNMGRCIAFEKSIMFIVQANLLEEPEYHDDAMMWYLKIDNATNLYVESMVPILGSAWIEKASDYYPNEFGWLVAEYQAEGSEEWVACADTIFNEVFSNEICQWNTTGLDQGSYTIRLTMSDNTVDENKLEVVKQIVLTEDPTNIKNFNISKTRIYPNPSTGIINIQSDNIKSIQVFTIDGQQIAIYKNTKQIYLSSLKPGQYFLKIQTNSECNTERVNIIDK